MTGADLGPWGPALAIAVMALATYLCRISGVVLMSRVRITPVVERTLAALPGSIVAATVVPIAIRSGFDGMAAILAGVIVMALTRNQVATLFAGLATAAGLRAAAHLI